MIIVQCSENHQIYSLEICFENLPQYILNQATLWFNILCQVAPCLTILSQATSYQTILWQAIHWLAILRQATLWLTFYVRLHFSWLYWSSLPYISWHCVGIVFKSLASDIYSRFSSFGWFRVIHKSPPTPPRECFLHNNGYAKHIIPTPHTYTYTQRPNRPDNYQLTTYDEPGMRAYVNY